MPGDIYLGSSGWAYSSWKPDFYPSKLSSKKFLEYYATRLNSVEVNYTFRALPSASMTQSWLAVTGPDFRFSFKAPQKITHILRLKNCASALADFSRALEPLVSAKRMGVVLFQLPPNFKADRERLDSFLSEAAAINLRLAFEFRHESWFADEIYSVLRRHEAALCVAESDELATPDVVTAPFYCYRLRKSDYSVQELDEIRSHLQHRAEAGNVFAYFKHEEEPTGAMHAAALLKELRRL
ncbi:MAG TPA: DUF72 domain-containing protein [Pseudacidobacterium sp.]|jgi:uncharacterized protein YecE (DUF72 family)|nr:DUF72 domain-containing protein [Pseudacidobacterium sp.]